MGKVYVLISYSWDESECENCIGIFTSEELVVKAANDYLVYRFNNMTDEDEKIYYKMPKTPITFEQLCDSYEYYNHRNFYGSTLYAYECELDKTDF